MPRLSVVASHLPWCCCRRRRRLGGSFKV